MRIFFGLIVCMTIWFSMEGSVSEEETLSKITQKGVLGERGGLLHRGFLEYKRAKFTVICQSLDAEGMAAQTNRSFMKYCRNHLRCVQSAFPWCQDLSHDMHNVIASSSYLMQVPQDRAAFKAAQTESIRAIKKIMIIGSIHFELEDQKTNRGGKALEALPRQAPGFIDDILSRDALRSFCERTFSAPLFAHKGALALSTEELPSSLQLQIHELLLVSDKIELGYRCVPEGIVAVMDFFRGLAKHKILVGVLPVTNHLKRQCRVGKGVKGVGAALLEDLYISFAPLVLYTQWRKLFPSEEYPFAALIESVYTSLKDRAPLECCKALTALYCFLHSWDNQLLYESKEDLRASLQKSQMHPHRLFLERLRHQVDDGFLPKENATAILQGWFQKAIFPLLSNLIGSSAYQYTGEREQRVCHYCWGLPEAHPLSLHKVYVTLKRKAFWDPGILQEVEEELCEELKLQRGGLENYLARSAVKLTRIVWAHKTFGFQEVTSESEAQGILFLPQEYRYRHKGYYKHQDLKFYVRNEVALFVKAADYFPQSSGLLDCFRALFIPMREWMAWAWDRAF